MIPRSDYMENKVDHRTYYAQFVNTSVISIVSTAIGERRICASEDPNLNDIPLREWDRLHHAIGLLVGKQLRDIDGCVSLCNTCCVAKEAARQIQDYYNNLQKEQF